MDQDAREYLRHFTNREIVEELERRVSSGGDLNGDGSLDNPAYGAASAALNGVRFALEAGGLMENR